MKMSLDELRRKHALDLAVIGTQYLKDEHIIQKAECFYNFLKQPTRGVTMADKSKPKKEAKKPVTSAKKLAKKKGAKK